MYAQKKPHTGTNPQTGDGSAAGAGKQAAPAKIKAVCRRILAPEECNSLCKALHFCTPDAGRDGLPGLLAALQNGKNL